MSCVFEQKVVEIGSRSLQCNTEGKCQCKKGVTGEKCDRCEANFYHFSSSGCESCGCEPRGSLDNIPSCDPETGVCTCKENVEGKQQRQRVRHVCNEKICAKNG